MLSFFRSRTGGNQPSQINIPKPLLKSGDRLAVGDSKGWIVCASHHGHAFLVSPIEEAAMTWREGLAYAGRQNAQLPNTDQLRSIQKEAAAGRLLHVFGAAAYWSSTGSTGSEYGYSYAVSQDGRVIEAPESTKLSIRLVRSLILT